DCLRVGAGGASMIPAHEIAEIEERWKRVEFFGVIELEHSAWRQARALDITELPTDVRKLLDENVRLRKLMPIAEEISDYISEGDVSVKEWNTRAGRIRDVFRELEA